MIRAVAADHLLACELALPIHRIAAVRTVEFRIGTLRIAFENVVRGNGDQPDAVSVTGGCDICRSAGVQFISEIALCFAFVHRSHCRAVNHCVRRIFPDDGVNAAFIRDVGFRQIRGDYFKVCEFCTERTSEHSPAAGQKNFHFRYSLLL